MKKEDVGYFRFRKKIDFIGCENLNRKNINKNKIE